MREKSTDLRQNEKSRPSGRLFLCFLHAWDPEGAWVVVNLVLHDWINAIYAWADGGLRVGFLEDGWHNWLNWLRCWF
jgi:hypothetical protein